MGVGSVGVLPSLFSSSLMVAGSDGVAFTSSGAGSAGLFSSSTETGSEGTSSSATPSENRNLAK